MLERAREKVRVLKRQRERVRQRAREIEGERDEDLKMQIYILSHAGYESSFILFKFQWFGDSIQNEFRGPFLQRQSKLTEALNGRHPIDNL